MLTVRDALNYYGLKDCDIMYRTIGPDGEDVFAGYCHYNGGEELIPADGDSYSLEDKICDFAVDSDQYLIVWYESQWVK